jgi:hypothetical protein
MIRCLHCGAETSNGLALCELCRRAVMVNLEFIAVYFRNLSRWRPGRAGTRDVPGSREPRIPLPTEGDAVSRALDESHADLTGWARSLADDRPGMARVIERILGCDEEPTARLLCVLFARRIDSLSTLEWIGEFARGTQRIESRLGSLTVRCVPGWYAGACRRCEVPTFVVPGLTWVTCGGCGTTTYARDHLEVVLDEAREWVGRPKALAEALVALLDTEMSVPRLYERIHKWGQREKIPTIRRTQRAHAFDMDAERIIVITEEFGPPRFRLGDILDEMDRERRAHADAPKRSVARAAC